MSQATYDLGILGGGQLARMSIQAAQRLGLRCISLDNSVVTAASILAPSIVGRLDDAHSIRRLLDCCEHVTLENEFIPAESLREAFALGGFDEEQLVPGVETLGLIQDKLSQRRAYTAAGVASPRAVAIDGEGETAIQEIGFPMVLKARFGGYDGKGTRYAKTLPEFRSYQELWGGGGWLAEQFVPFVRELAVIVFADRQSFGAFPTVETVQSKHVCDLVFPAANDASALAIAAVNAVRGRGLFGVELFELADGELMVNEIAPRPHNSGHYTLDWGATSQFEQHVRVACELEMDPAPRGLPTCMANILGIEGAGDFRAGLRRMQRAMPDAHLHWYEKGEARPGRKMGHINVVGAECVARAQAARSAFLDGWIA